MRLTAELIHNSLSYLNPLKERELDLRGHRIPAIENLGVATDHDAFDLTDNEIASLANFPLSTRLRTILAARNRISSIQPTLHKSIPNLTTLVLAANRLQELTDLDPLGAFPKLTHLVLAENPVCKKEHYRSWILWRCPALRFLDYQRVRKVERDDAATLFGTAAAPTALASKILNIKSRTFASSTGPGTSSTANNDSGKIERVQLSASEKARLQQLIKKASSMDEIARIEKELHEGRIPAGVADGDAMDES